MSGNAVTYTAISTLSTVITFDVSSATIDLPTVSANFVSSQSGSISCSESASAQIVIDQDCSFALSIDTINETCNGSDDGEIKILVD